MTDVKQISDFKLERYLLGELPEVEMTALRKREAEDELFAARVKMMREEGERFLAENPFSGLEDKLENDQRSVERSTCGCVRYFLGGGAESPDGNRE